MPEIKQGWTGAYIPIEVQAVTLMRHYRQAIAVAAANMARLHQQVEAKLSPIEDGGGIAHALGDDHFFIKLLGKLQQNEEKFGDALFRGTNVDAYREGGCELEDMITYLAVALWIEDGAEFPDGLMESYETDDEEE